MTMRSASSGGVAGLTGLVSEVFYFYIYIRTFYIFLLYYILSFF